MKEYRVNDMTRLDNTSAGNFACGGMLIVLGDSGSSGTVSAIFVATCATEELSGSTEADAPRLEPALFRAGMFVDDLCYFDGVMRGKGSTGRVGNLHLVFS